MLFNFANKKDKFLSLIWCIPLIALCISSSLIYDTYLDKGPVITLIMNSAEGITERKTIIKALNVDVGKVTSIKLSKDLKYVEATVQMNKDTEQLLKEDTVFFIQKPRIDRQGVSGLNTLLSGYYIELLPGNKGKAKNKYFLSEQLPIKILPDSLTLKLYTDKNRPLSVGDEVKYKGLDAGVIISKEYDLNLNKVNYTVVINKDFAHLVNSNTVFWVNSGISLEMNSYGVKFYTESIENLLRSGISFDNLDEFEANSVPSKNGDTYKLFASKSDIEPQYKDILNYVLIAPFFSNNIVTNTPIYYKGIQIGRVKKAPYLLDNFKLFKNDWNFYPILFSIETERFEKNNKRSLNVLKQDIDNFIEKNNIIAELEMKNLLTGTYIINLHEDLASKENTTLPKEFNNYKVIYIKDDSLTTIKKDMENFVKSLNNLKIDEMIITINSLLNNVNTTSKEIKDLSNSLNLMIEQLNKNNLSTEIIATLKQIRNTLNAYDEKSSLYSNLDETLNTLNTTLKSLQPITQNLEQKSNSLFFENEQTDPEIKDLIKKKLENET